MDALLDEVESLEAILMDELRVTRNSKSDIPEVIETTVFPLVGDESEQRYVCVTLQVIPQPGYPDVSPDFKLLRPRGLDDARLDEIKAACVAKLQDALGFPVVFDLIEAVREHLSGSNMPSGQCVICLYGFSDGDEFTRTECFHYLHSYCLARHLNALRRNYQEEYDKLPAWLQKTADPFQAACPVCREPINDETDSLKCAMPPAELQNAPDFKLTRQLRELQQRMANLFLQQKSRGGIIDVDAESGGVIAIETEQEIRRRLQKKKRDEEAANAANATESSSYNHAMSFSAAGEVVAAGNGCDASETSSSTAEQRDTIHCKPSSSNSSGNGGSATNFAPVVQQTQRISSDPTNNNYQHQSQQNRRHFRGGRRHQHHHHHHRDRYEQHNHHGNAGGGASAGTTASAATATGSGTAGGKQTKSQAAGASHAR